MEEEGGATVRPWAASAWGGAIPGLLLLLLAVLPHVRASQLLRSDGAPPCPGACVCWSPSQHQPHGNTLEERGLPGVC